MRYDGKLVKWDDDRGFGFIGTRDGGHEIFVHVSAFPRPGPRPQVGEMLSFEVEMKKDGRKQAVRIHRVGHVPPPRRQGPAQPRGGRSRKSWNGAIAVLLVAGIGAYAFKEFSRRPPPPPSPEGVEPARAATPPRPPAFRCDGRTHCSRMTSCEEAKFFLKNCPGTEMDGNNDGIPCERQWCTSPFAR